ncbi:MAG: gamma carbonic anhydrase family protein, partial [Raoultibacter sp.]
MNYHQVKIDPFAHIAPNASITGNVTIGKDCTIFAHTALRGDYGRSIVMEEGSNLQENCCVHVSEGCS